MSNIRPHVNHKYFKLFSFSVLKCLYGLQGKINLNLASYNSPFHIPGSQIKHEAIETETLI